MAQVVKRAREGGGASYRVRWRLNGARDGAWQSVTVRNSASAKTLKAIVESKGHRVRADEMRDPSVITGGKVARSGGPTFGEVAQRYIDTRTTSKEWTRTTYSRIVRLHLSEWSDRPIAEITSDDVAALVNRLQREDRSVAAIFDFARSVFRYATHLEPPLRAGDPTALVKVSRKKTRTRTFLTREEADVLLAACCEIMRPIVEVVLYTGLRAGEVRGMRVRDLHLTGKTPSLTVSGQIVRAMESKASADGDPKSEASARTIALDDNTAALLRSHVNGKQPGDYVFTNPKTGTFWRHSTFEGGFWHPTVARALESGLGKRPRFHDLRHTHASWLLSAGVPLLTVSRRLGHESVAVTANTYGHIQPEADDQIRSVLAR